MEPDKPHRRHRILIIDDDDGTLGLFQALLGNGFDIATETSGETGVSMALEFQPDMVLLDVTMPGIDGYETCRRILAEPRLRGVKVIMVSGRDSEAERLRGLGAGAEDYVTKPFDPMRVLDLVRAHLSSTPDPAAEAPCVAGEETLAEAFEKFVSEIDATMTPNAFFRWTRRHNTDAFRGMRRELITGYAARRFRDNLRMRGASAASR